ncbi:MAG: hypothetical protein KDC53_22575 [Saprospiraceae bacterium]|nr:hypothetical protein [Saprospiraceae bacterium]
MKTILHSVMTTVIILTLTPYLSNAQSVSFEIGSADPNIDPPVVGAGARFMWYADRIALRAGLVTDDQWDKDQTGLLSTAWGHDNVASGSHSTSWGQLNFASGDISTAWGFRNNASGFLSTSMGGQNISKGTASLTAGIGLRANSLGETVIGIFNDTLTKANAANYVNTDYLFVVGNGADEANRSNALTVFKSGHIQMKALVFEYDSLVVNADNELVDMKSFSYLKIGATFDADPNNRTVILANGSYTGQVLILQCIQNNWQLLDGTSNVNLPANRVLSVSDTIQLIWNGSTWLETHFSNN